MPITDRSVGPGSRFEGRRIDSGEESMLGLVLGLVRGQELVRRVLRSPGDVALEPFQDS